MTCAPNAPPNGAVEGYLHGPARFCIYRVFLYNPSPMVVRMRRNRSQTAQRRSHHALKGGRTATCECGELRQPHRACPACGKYNGRIVVDVVAQQKRQARRAKRKETELRESGQIKPQTDGEKEKESATV
jgi:large subunit ribosomal protein L32